MPQVLLVDDDPGQLRIRELMLRGAGIAVNTAQDFESALGCLRASPCEIVALVTDHNLPGGQGGADLVRELRRTDSSLPIMVLSGMPGIESEYDGLDVTIQFKPIPPPEFIGLVRKLIAQ